jgi:hypothetical protein
MALNTFTQSPLSVTGVRPGQWFLTSSENYNTLITPGFLNSLVGAGLEIHNGDFVYANFNNGSDTQIFTVDETAGVFTMSVYSPNSNSFVFERTLFVAKGGSDFNTGTTMGDPKLTIQNAINTLAPNLIDQSLVVVMDDGIYDENITLPNNITLSAPNATLTATTGDCITIPNTGNQTSGIVRCLSINVNPPGKAVVVNGASSVCFLYAGVVFGSLYVDGALVLPETVAWIAGDAETTATGQFYGNIINCIATTFTTAGSVYGKFGQVPGVTDIRGNTSFIDKLIFQSEPITEVVGRILSITDSNSRIVYNNASDDGFTLPSTADVAMPIGTTVEFTQLGLGAIAFLPGTGVTLVTTVSLPASSNGPASTCRAYKYTDTIWILSGDLIGGGA